MKRISVIGTSGSGKTTFARQIAQCMGVPHVELDALHWEPNWQEAPVDIFRQRVQEALRGDAWVVDGNYSIVRSVVWERADTVVWLDFSFPVVFTRILKRTARRVFTREELWNTGNRESLRMTFLSRDSILLWVLKTYRRRRREYPELFRKPENAHLQIIRLTSPRRAAAWLSELDQLPIPAETGSES